VNKFVTIKNKKFKEGMVGAEDYKCPKCGQKFSSNEMFAYKGKCPKCDETLRPFFKSYKAIGRQDVVID